MNRVQEIDFTNIKVHEILAMAERTKVDWLGFHADRVMERARNPKEMSGLTTPWEKLEDKFRIRGGELSVLGAYNGDGKSTLSCQLAVHLAQSVPVGIASLEMEIEDLGVMMAQQASLSDNPTEASYQKFFDWSANRIAVYDRLDAIKPEESLACLYHMIVNLGCKFLILDSLMMVNVTEDTEKERRFVQTLAALAKKYQVHIMLIHHVRKPSSQGKSAPMPTKYDLLGSSHLSNMAMTVLMWWKDREQQEARHFGEHDLTKPDYKLCVAKQRFGRFEGTLGFYESKGRSFASTRRGDLRHINFGA